MMHTKDYLESGHSHKIYSQIKTSLLCGFKEANIRKLLIMTDAYERIVFILPY